MTIEEATYFKEYIERRLNEILQSLTNEEQNTFLCRRFEEQYMNNITGQQELPQSVFRQFLRKIDFSAAKDMSDNAKALIEEAKELIAKAEQIDIIGKPIPPDVIEEILK